MHPEQGLCIGPIDEYVERNARVGRFLQQAYLQEAERLVHRELTSGPADAALQNLAIGIDTNIACTLQMPYVVTLRDGCPRTPVRPENIDTRIWEYITRTTQDESQFLERTGNKEQHYVIGGLFEACVANVAWFLKSRGGSVQVIEDLCATWSEEHRNTARVALLERGIDIIQYEDL